jgi:hypothetical protein
MIAAISTEAGPEKLLKKSVVVVFGRERRALALRKINAINGALAPGFFPFIYRKTFSAPPLAWTTFKRSQKPIPMEYTFKDSCTARRIRAKIWVQTASS